jgi:peptidoglycan-N-acetylmuramic acid deacetylase
MIGRLLIPAFLSVFILMSVSGCRGSKPASYDLYDLGGVYASRESDLDLRIEISGRLSEGNPKSFETNEANISIGEHTNQGIYSNKLLRWGMSRRDNNQTPAADPGAPELLAKYGGAYIGDIQKRTIYFTFDEGYENGYTPKILDALRDNNVKAIFFITGPYLKVHQDLVRRMVEEGHIIGNHTIHHPSLPEMDDSRLEEEVLGLDRAFQEKFGEQMKFLRPPKGEYSERSLAITQKLGYCNLFWSFAYDDWYRDRIRGPEYAYTIVMRNLHNGAVLLLHAVSKDNADALDTIIKGALEKGYEIGDPNEILSLGKAGSG